MRSLIVAVYRLVYNVTRFKLFSLVVAIAYISLLNLIMIYGLGLLVEGWLPTSIVHKLFAFPYIIFSALLMTYLIYRATPNRKNLSKDAKKVTKYTAVIIYTALCILVLVYVKYQDKIIVDPAPKRKRFKNPKNAFYQRQAPVRCIEYMRDSVPGSLASTLS